MKRPYITYGYFIVFFILIIVLIINFVRSITLYNENKSLENDLLRAQNIQQEIGKLENKLNNTPIRIQNSIKPIRMEVFNLASTITEGKNVRVISIGQKENREVSNYNIVTYLIEFEGNYTDLIKATYDYEAKSSNSKISAINFEVLNLKGNRQKAVKLKTELYVQGVTLLE